MAGRDVGGPTGLHQPWSWSGKALFTRLAEVGCTVFEIMSISGHKNVEEVQKYVDTADRKKLAVAALGKLQAGQLANA